MRARLLLLKVGRGRACCAESASEAACGEFRLMRADRIRPARRNFACLLLPFAATALWVLPIHACEAESKEALSIQRKLEIAPLGQARQILDLDDAMRVLHIPSASVTVIDGGSIAWSRTFGVNSEKSAVYQAASMSKFVAAVVAMKLVDDLVLSLDAPVDAKLKMWKSARPSVTDGRPVTLRWLLSMRAGINVPGFTG